MFYLNASIKNPFWKSEYNKYFDSYVCVEKPISKNKVFNFEITRHFYHLFQFILKTEFRGMDHAGPSLELGLFGYNVMVCIYDTRHWDDEKNTWKNYE